MVQGPSVGQTGPMDPSPFSPSLPDLEFAPVGLGAGPKVEETGATAWPEWQPCCTYSTQTSSYRAQAASSACEPCVQRGPGIMYRGGGIHGPYPPCTTYLDTSAID